MEHKSVRQCANYLAIYNKDAEYESHLKAFNCISHVPDIGWFSHKQTHNIQCPRHTHHYKQLCVQDEPKTENREIF
jgi:hypothetical protein